MRPRYVAVCGGSPASDHELVHAEEVGRLLAEAGVVVVTGGMGGVMEAAARGARVAGGIAIGILPTAEHDDGNEFNTVVVPTGLGEARNAIVVRAADAIIAIGGAFGTLSEIAFGLKSDKPVIGIDTWQLRRKGVPPEPNIRHALTPSEAVELALRGTANR